MSEIRNQLAEHYRQSQGKNAYFLLAASASAIGFAITQLKVEPLTCIHIPLGISFLLWGISFYSGQRYLQWLISIVGKNLDYLSTNYFPEIPDELKKESLNKTKEIHDSKTKFYGPLQINTLFFGAMFYISYHLILMVQAGV